MPEAIKGLEELKRKLATLGPKVEKKILRAAWRKGANTIRDASRRLAPVDTGLLKKKIMTVSARGKPGTIRFQVRATARKVSQKYPEPGYPYPSAVEKGHGFPGTRARLFGKTPKQEEFGDSQVPAQPFMRPAWEQNKEDVLTTFADEVGKGIEKLAKEPA
jgi:HK97 gp10 family phage protein